MNNIKIKSITIIGRRWFQSTYGNTYHSVIAYVDGENVINTPFRYGYGDHYIQTATEELERGGYIPGFIHHDNGGNETLWRYCERKNIQFLNSVTDVTRKRDL